jgi:hypothetical protein
MKRCTLMALALLVTGPAVASGTCLIEVDGPRYLDGPCDVRAGRHVIFIGRGAGRLQR